jgi:hypothetical protein
VNGFDREVQSPRLGCRPDSDVVLALFADSVELLARPCTNLARCPVRKIDMKDNVLTSMLGKGLLALDLYEGVARLHESLTVQPLRKQRKGHPQKEQKRAGAAMRKSKTVNIFLLCFSARKQHRHLRGKQRGCRPIGENQIGRNLLFLQLFSVALLSDGIRARAPPMALWQGRDACGCLG